MRLLLRTLVLLAFTAIPAVIGEQGVLVVSLDMPQQQQSEQEQQRDLVTLVKITRTVLAKHNKATDCWLAIYGKVYNLTAFAKVHPGGRTKITSRCGTVATTAFSAQHKDTARLSRVANKVVGVLSS
jgi:cytochrome b involved in lipid metabolism